MPEGVRTHDLLLRRQTLYPAELRAQRILINLIHRKQITIKDKTKQQNYFDNIKKISLIDSKSVFFISKQVVDG